MVWSTDGSTGDIDIAVSDMYFGKEPTVFVVQLNTVQLTEVSAEWAICNAQSGICNDFGIVTIDKTGHWLHAENPEKFYLDTVMNNSQRYKILRNAICLESVLTAVSLAFAVKSVPCGGLLMVGDATGFIAPFTGEGIYLSLRSSEIAVEVAEKALKNLNFSRDALNIYEVRRRKEFDKNWEVIK